jgi:hypothetical protein
MTTGLINRSVIAAVLLLRHASDPLSARFLPPDRAATTRQFGYTLNDRAYVAVFLIVPGRGVVVLYPFNPPSTLEVAGDHVVPLQSAGIRQEQRLAALQSQGEQAGASPLLDGSYLLLVASRQPLHLDPYLTRPEALDSALGPTVQRSGSMDAVVTGLVRVVANVRSADDFAYDVDEARAVIPKRR